MNYAQVFSVNPPAGYFPQQVLAHNGFVQQYPQQFLTPGNQGFAAQPQINVGVVDQAEAFDEYLAPRQEVEPTEQVIQVQVPRFTYEMQDVPYQEPVYEYRAMPAPMVPRVVNGVTQMVAQGGTQSQIKSQKCETNPDGTFRPLFQPTTRKVQVPKLTYETQQIKYFKRLKLFNEPGIWIWYLSHVQREAGREASEIWNYHKYYLNAGQMATAGGFNGECWLDVKMLDKGFGAMMEGVELCRVFICILSDSYLKNDNCRKELKHAIANKKPIVVCFQKDKPHLVRQARAEFKELDNVPAVELIMHDPDYCNVAYKLLSERALEVEKFFATQSAHETFVKQQNDMRDKFEKEQKDMQERWKSEQGFEPSVHGVQQAQMPQAQMPPAQMPPAQMLQAQMPPAQMQQVQMQAPFVGNMHGLGHMYGGNVYGGNVYGGNMYGAYRSPSFF